MDIKQKLVSGFAWEAASKLIVQLFSWFSTIYVARVLDPSDYGVVAISGIFVGFSLMFGGMGLCAGIIQKKDITQKEIDSVFWVSMILNVAVFGIVYFSSPYIADFYEIPILADVIKVAALIVIISSLSIVPRANKLRELDFRFTSLAALAAGFVTTLTVFSLAVSGYGLWSLVVSTLAGEICLTIIYLTQLKSLPKLVLDLRGISGLIKYGFGLMITRLSQFFNAKVGVIASGTFLGETSTGYYQFSETLSRMPMDKIGGLFQTIAFASLSKVQDDKELSKELLFKFHRYLVFVSYPILGGASFVAEDLVLLLLTDKWLPMVPVLQLVCALAAMTVSLQLLPKFLEGQGKVKELVRFQLSLLVVTLVAMCFGAQYSLEGMVISALCVYPFLYMQLLRYILPMLDVSSIEFFKSFSVVVVVNLIMLIILALVSPYLEGMSTLLRLVLNVGIGAVSYLLLAFIFMKEDILALKSVLAKNEV